MSKQILRQGDVLLIPVAQLPMGAAEVKVPATLILMHGEATGHAHRIERAEQSVRVWEKGVERFIQALAAPVALVHEEHAPVALQKEVIYKQCFQVQEQGQEVRRVED